MRKLLSCRSLPCLKTALWVSCTSPHFTSPHLSSPSPAQTSSRASWQERAPVLLSAFEKFVFMYTGHLHATTIRRFVLTALAGRRTNLSRHDFKHTLECAASQIIRIIRQDILTARGTFRYPGFQNMLIAGGSVWSTRNVHVCHSL